MEQLFDDLEDFGSFDDAISGDVRDPYTELARLRREEPVQRLEMSGALPHEEGLPMFIVYRHEDVQQMLRDNETFSSAAVIAAFGPVLGEGVMLGMDEPIHGRLRSLISKAFSQKSLARWEDELVGRVANSLIDKFAPNGKADLVKEFTFDYPSQIIAGLLGQGGPRRANPRGTAPRAEGRPNQRARCGRDRRGEARRRGDLLVPSAA